MRVLREDVELAAFVHWIFIHIVPDIFNVLASHACICPPLLQQLVPAHSSSSKYEYHYRISLARHSGTMEWRATSREASKSLVASWLLGIICCWKWMGHEPVRPENRFSFNRRCCNHVDIFWLQMWQPHCWVYSAFAVDVRSFAVGVDFVEKSLYAEKTPWRARRYLDTKVCTKPRRTCAADDVDSLCEHIQFLGGTGKRAIFSSSPN